MDHQRSATRSRSFLKGRVLFNGGLTSLECLVRDLSATGARLEISASITLPDRFDLYLPHRDTTYKVYIQWRRDDQLGVAFDTAQSAPSAPPEQDLAARVQQLEAEMGLMRLLLTQMKSELDGLKAGKQRKSSPAA